jgi:hypothetical protein
MRWPLGPVTGVRKPSPLRHFAFVLAFGLGITQACAQAPTTRPAESRPDAVGIDTQPVSPDPARQSEMMAKWFAELASADGKVRDAAKVSLMGLGRDDLPALRKLVEQRRPLLPSQAVVLKEIVTQIWLSSDTFDVAVNGRDGFLGIRPAEVSVGTRPPDDQPGQQAVPPAPQVMQFPGEFGVDPSQVCGIMVMDRMPGFAGARVLQNGDVILGIAERPKIQFRGAADFSLAVRALGSGEKVHFDVLRQGQVIRVEIILGPRPDDAESVIGGINPMQKLLDRRAKEVDDLWEAQFAPLLEEGVG